jgi:hypothetical protein
MPITPLAQAQGELDEASIIPPDVKFEDIRAMVDSVLG